MDCDIDVMGVFGSYDMVVSWRLNYVPTYTLVDGFTAYKLTRPTPLCPGHGGASNDGITKEPSPDSTSAAVALAAALRVSYLCIPCLTRVSTDCSTIVAQLGYLSYGRLL